MAALDTNVLARFLVKDDIAQLALVQQLFEHYGSQNKQLFVPKAVVLELEWVLRNVYEVQKADFVQGLSNLLSTVELAFEDESVVEEALDMYQGTNSDFADCLHLTTTNQASQVPLWTFDKKASKLPGARRLNPAELAELVAPHPPASH